VWTAECSFFSLRTQDKKLLILDKFVMSMFVLFVERSKLFDTAISKWKIRELDAVMVKNTLDTKWLLATGYYMMSVPCE